MKHLFIFFKLVKELTTFIKKILFTETLSQKIYLFLKKEILNCVTLVGVLKPQSNKKEPLFVVQLII